jgi:hypothetical protein
MTLSRFTFGVAPAERPVDEHSRKYPLSPAKSSLSGSPAGTGRRSSLPRPRADWPARLISKLAVAEEGGPSAAYGGPAKPFH